MNTKEAVANQRIIKVAIVDDEQWQRENLSRIISKTPGLHCVSSYSTAEEALPDIAAKHPDVVLLDINLPGMDGVKCLRELRTILPEAQVLMLTVFDEGDKIFNSLVAGASGYLLKRSSTSELLAAIRQVHDGASPMSASIARKVIEYFRQMGQDSPDTKTLSPREKDVLELLARGASYKEIADQLSLSVETIRMNARHIYHKLHVRSRGEATAKYMRHSWFRRLS